MTWLPSVTCDLGERDVGEERKRGRGEKRKGRRGEGRIWDGGKRGDKEERRGEIR